MKIKKKEKFMNLQARIEKSYVDKLKKQLKKDKVSIANWFRFSVENYLDLK